MCKSDPQSCFQMEKPNFLQILILSLGIFLLHRSSNFYRSNTTKFEKLKNFIPIEKPSAQNLVFLIYPCPIDTGQVIKILKFRGKILIEQNCDNVSWPESDENFEATQHKAKMRLTDLGILKPGFDQNLLVVASWNLPFFESYLSILSQLENSQETSIKILALNQNLTACSQHECIK